MSLKGLPDFQRPIQGDGFQIFYPYEGGASYVLVPGRLRVASRHDGRPDFTLEMVRGQNPLLPPAPYGLLDFRLQPDAPIDDALARLRSRHPGAMITGALFSSGFLRMRAFGDGAGEIPKELLQPNRLAWNGLSTARLIIKLSMDGAQVLKSALEDELLTLDALAELEVEGVSPRVPVRVRFNPAELLGKLVALGDARRQIARDELLRFFRRGPNSLPLEVVGGIKDDFPLDDFAEAMADWTRVRFGAFVTSPKDDAKSYLALADPVEVGGGRFEWDLSQPVKVPRPFVLYLHPLEAARSLVRDAGLEAVVRETVVPQITTGMFPVTVSANLPPYRVGVVALGATLKAPPRPPQRFQALIKTVELNPPEDSATAVLRFSPAEKPQYTCATFVVLEDSGGVEQVEGEAKTHERERLALDVEDFPVNFFLIEASRALLELADVRGICRRPKGAARAEQSFELNLDHPSVALATPLGVADGTLEVEARSRLTPKTLKLDPLPIQDLQLGLHSFPAYGPHTVTIECALGDGQNSLAIELLPEGSAEAPAEITVLHFTPARPMKEWSYFAQSPFAAGYRYRLRQSATGQPAAPWSRIHSPFEKLKISAAQVPEVST